MGSTTVLVHTASVLGSFRKSFGGAQAARAFCSASRARNCLRASTQKLWLSTVQVTVSARCANPLLRTRPFKKTFFTMLTRPSSWARRRCNRWNFQEPLRCRRPAGERGQTAL